MSAAAVARCFFVCFSFFILCFLFRCGAAVVFHFPYIYFLRNENERMKVTSRENNLLEQYYTCFFFANINNFVLCVEKLLVYHGAIAHFRTAKLRYSLGAILKKVISEVRNIYYKNN